MPQGLAMGTRVRIISGRYSGKAGTVDANVFQRTVDYPDEFAAGFHLVLNDETAVIVRWDQVKVVPLDSSRGDSIAPGYGQSS